MAGGFQLLHLVQPFMPLLPEVQSSNNTIPFRQKLLVGSKIIRVDYSIPEDRALLNGAQKLLGILITIMGAMSLVLSAMYGIVCQELGTGSAILIIIQLFFAAIVVIYLDELLKKGYGLVPGISLFTATSICGSIFWKAFSPFTICCGQEAEYEGAVIAWVHLLVTRTDKVRALHEAFFRQNLPNMTNLLATCLVFLIVIYLLGLHVLLPIRSRNFAWLEGYYTIKFFYISNATIVLQCALFTNLYFVAQRLYRMYSGNKLVNLLGEWKVSEYSGQSIPVGGIAYYLTAPSTLADVAIDPFRALFHTVFLLSGSALLSKMWIEIRGSSTRDVASLLNEQQMVMLGRRDLTFHRRLNHYVATAAIFGGLCIGVLTVLSDLMGAIGSGTGILLAASLLYPYFEEIVS